MKVLAIDAGRGSCIVSRSVEVAASAAEDVGAQVERIKLSRLTIRNCTNCKICTMGSGCKIHDDLAWVSEKIAEADSLIIGVTSSRKDRSKECIGMLERLSSYFVASQQHAASQQGFGGSGQSQKRIVIRNTPIACAAKRAVIITAAKSDSPLGLYFSPAKGAIKELREILSGSGLNPIGAIEASPRLSQGRLCKKTREQAQSFGRILAGKC